MRKTIVLVVLAAVIVTAGCITPGPTPSPVPSTIPEDSDNYPATSGNTDNYPDLPSFYYYHAQLNKFMGDAP